LFFGHARTMISKTLSSQWLFNNALCTGLL